MIHNYLITTFRNLRITFGYSFLNIFGLALGIAAAALIFLWVNDELSYDTHFPKKENIYVVKSKQGGDAVSGLLGPAIKEELPGVKYAARFDWGRSYLFKVNQNTIYQQGHIVDPEFMDIFSVQFVEGNRAIAMDKPNNLVITQSMAKRLFGDNSAIGKLVKVNEEDSYLVGGVVKDFPANSSIQFDWLIPFERFEKENAWVRDWNNAVIMTYVQLEVNAKVQSVNQLLNDLIKRKTSKEDAKLGNRLYPMSRWRLFNSFDSDGNEIGGRINNVRLFSIIAWTILVIACINFMNLATARSEKRAKEIGLRKVVGARRVTLILQFLGESFILVGISAILAIAFIFLAIGEFNLLIEKELSVDFSNPNHFLFLIIIVSFCTVFAGVYPAFYLSSLNPIVGLKGGLQKVVKTNTLRRILVIVQYSTSITLIICTVVIYLQIKHIQGRDMGYSMSQVMMVPLRGEAAKKIDLIKSQLLATGKVESVGLSSSSPLQMGVRTTMDWQGKDPNKDITLFYQWADDGFFPTFDLRLVDGRNFNQDMLSDSNSIVINEAFAKHITLDGKAAGKIVYWDGDPMKVVGVVNDFVFNNVYGQVEPAFFRAFYQSGGLLNIKTKEQSDLKETIRLVEKIIKTNNPAYPFEYSFLDDQFTKVFKSEQLIQKLVGTLGILSIVISCIGLVGLAAFMAEQRKKEFGIRKVLGASTFSIIKTVSREFIILVTLSCLLAFPIAWMLMNDWLNNYEYRTILNWWLFILIGIAGLITALLVVSVQAFNTASMNPIKNLRNE